MEDEEEISLKENVSQLRRRLDLAFLCGGGFFSIAELYCGCFGLLKFSMSLFLPI